MNNLMAAGTAPDVSYTFSYPIIQTYANMGGVLDMAPLLENYGDLIPDLRALLTDTNLYWNKDPQTGTIWSVIGRLVINPGLNLFVREDWLARLNLPMPRTLQEFEAMLYAFRDNAELLLGSRAREMIPYAISEDVGWTARNIIGSFIPHNTSDRDFFIYGFDDRLFNMPGTKEAARLLNRWYNERLIWQNFSLGGVAMGLDDLKKTGLVGAFIQNWDHPFRAGGVDINTTLQRLVGEEAKFVAVNPSPFQNDAGFPRRILSPSNDRNIFFPYTNTEPVASLLYINFISKLETRVFLQTGVENQNHVVHSDGAIQMLAATGIYFMNSGSNYDYTMTVNGLDLGNPELTARSLGFSYPDIPAADVQRAFYIPQDFDRHGKNVPVGEILAEEGLGPALAAQRDVVWNTSIVASVADFDRVYDQALQAYLNAGGQTIINERTQKWTQFFGNATMLP